MFSTKIYRVLFIVSLIIVTASLERPTSVFTSIPKTNENLDALRNLSANVTDVMYWKDPTGINKSVDLMVPGEQYHNFKSFMKKYELQYDLKIADVQELLNNATVPVKTTRSYTRYSGFGWTRFHSLDEIYAWLDALAQRYPNNVRTIKGGRSYEGRSIKGVHLRFSSEIKPGVFVEAGIHAREWITHTTATYLINELLTSRNPEIRRLAESFDWYIFPCTNPDGYVYTHVNPRDARYRLWRKTRSPTAGRYCWASGYCQERRCYGTDPNRNWGYKWGGPGSSTTDACSEIYAGSAPFSEIETKTLSEFISSVSDKLFAYISFHSYIEKLMFPYGFTAAHLDNYDQQLAVGRQAAYALSKRYGTRYEVGNIVETLGSPASGGSIDWVKGTFKIPFVYVYELRGRTSSGQPYGFTPPPSEIIPNGQEVVDSLVALFRTATQYYSTG